MFKRNNIAVLLGAVAAVATFAAPLTASANQLSQADQFSRQLSLSDGYQETDWDRSQSVTPAVLTPASPEAQDQLASFERQRSISDGYQETEWDQRQAPDFRVNAKSTDAMLQALLANFEAQRRISDGTN
jgi:hypothetical protein